MKQAYFISPHLDDAVFSCGAAMLSLQRQGYDCTVITVFTEAGGAPETLSARMFLKQIGMTSGASMYAERRQEDTRVLKQLGVASIHLGKVEALWRKVSSGLLLTLGQFLPELAHVYPTYKFHITSGKIANADRKFIAQLSAELAKLIPADAVVFCPVGIGGHVDHVVVREACKKLPNKIVFWGDIPYVARVGATPTNMDTRSLIKTELSQPQLLAKKDEFCQGYKTQYVPVFGPAGASKISEVFYGGTRIQL